MYNFSLPMPYKKENIDELIKFNKFFNKSQITSLYASLPSSCSMFTGFEQARNFLNNQTSFDYWKNLFSYSLEKGVDFIYLLNSPLPFDLNNSYFNEQLEKLNNLLQEFKKIGINKLRVANPQLMTYLNKHYSNFDIYSSTSLDYKTISEYQNFIMMHPEIKQIIPSHDVNKNFKLLSNLKKDYPNLDIEIMVNEGCMQGCPHRSLHEHIKYNNSVIQNNDLSISGSYCQAFCTHIIKKYPFYSLTLNNNIYPWEIEEYSKMGINKFKMVGRDAYIYRFEKYLKEFFEYFKTIDNYKESKNFSIVSFIHHLNGSNELKKLKTEEIRYLLPQIKHFKKYGHLCTSVCGVECRYCYKCAEKIQKVYEKKVKKMEKQPHYVPACKMT